MAPQIVQEARLETSEDYRLSFSMADEPGCGWSFPCDSAGHVDGDLSPAALDNLRLCQQGFDALGHAIVPDGLKVYRHTYRVPAIARCECGADLPLASSWLNVCTSCGRDFDATGTALALRQHWGEETGEHWADLVAV